jgi:alkaline phosphatase
MDENKNPLKSALLKMQDKGWKTGVITTEGINDATPAAFYAHRYRREMTEIALDATDSGVDFFGGSAFLIPKNKKDPTDSILNKFRNNGYEILRGKDAYEKSNKSSKILMIPEKKYPLALPYSIDRKEDDMKLLDLTSSAIDFLQKNNDKGFFLMIEGGEIDHASHVNDLGTVVREVIDLDENINLAYQFYLKHPDETLILVTADHETGGLGLGTKYTSLNIQALQHQKVSLNRLSSLIREMRNNSSVAWEDIKNILTKKLGFWNEIKISENDETKLIKCFEDTFINKNNTTVNTLYAKDEPLAVEAIAVLNRICEVGWTTNSHTAGVVPVYAIGVGAENFMGRMDNVDISNRLLNLLEN